MQIVTYVMFALVIVAGIYSFLSEDSGGGSTSTGSSTSQPMF